MVVCRLLRNNPETRSIPIMMITALDDNIHRTIAKTLGADELVVKPFSLQDVVERGAELIRRRYMMEPAGDGRYLGY